MFKVGDIVEYVHKSDNCFTKGQHYEVTNINDEEQLIVVTDDEGDNNEMDFVYFELVKESDVASTHLPEFLW